MAAHVQTRLCLGEVISSHECTAPVRRCLCPANVHKDRVISWGWDRTQSPITCQQGAQKRSGMMQGMDGSDLLLLLAPGRRNALDEVVIHSIQEGGQLLPLLWGHVLAQQLVPCTALPTPPISAMHTSISLQHASLSMLPFATLMAEGFPR